MKIRPIAADSLGTRSMATLVATRDTGILIDPSTSLAPDRYGLEPHPLEVKRWKEHWQSIAEQARLAEVVVVTHYHYDHYYPKRTDVFEGKTLLIKDPEQRMNLNQKRRGLEFIEIMKKIARKIEISDGRQYQFGRTRIVFSGPVLHGKDEKHGSVVEVLIEEDSRFLFTADVQGPLNQEQLDFVLRHSPEIVYLDGPLTYMLGQALKKSDLAHAIENIEKILGLGNLQRLIVDHHLLRDIDWRQKMARIFSLGKASEKISTAAEFIGKPDEPLEARRRLLYG